MPPSRKALVLVVVVVAAAGVASAGPRGSPDLSAFAPDNRVTAGEETTLGVHVLNGGEVDVGSAQPGGESQVTTARNVRVTLSAGDAPVEVRTGTRPVGNVPQGSVGPIPFAVSVDENATPGRYRLPVRIGYKYTRQIVTNDPSSPDHQEATETITGHVTLVIEPDARFRIEAANADAFRDGSGTVALRVTNVGSAAARNARFAVTSESPSLTFGGSPTARTFLGRWGPGETRTVTLDGLIAEGADRRSFPVSATVTYEDDDGRTRQSEALAAGVTPGARTSRFEVVNASVDVAVGDQGTIRVAMRHAGGSRIDDAVITLESGDRALTFGGSGTAGVYVGSWGPGEVRTFAFSARVAEGTDVRPYPVTATVRFRDDDGNVRRSDPLFGGFVPDPEQSFALRNVTSTLAVGEEGAFRGVIENTGSSIVRNAVVVFSAGNPNVVPVETEYAIGDLAPGEAATFGFAAEVSDSADAGPRQLSVTVRYRDANDDVRRSDPVDATVAVGPKRDVFAVDPVNASLAVGSSGRLELRVTNGGNETVTDVSAKLFADDPISADDDEAFVDRLAPGETATVVFGIGVAGGALEKTYPVSIDFQYDDADGDTVLSDTYQVPIRVASSGGGGGLGPAIVGLVLVALLGAGAYLYRRGAIP